jgi:uncharacterized protein (TIGR02145 family)
MKILLSVLFVSIRCLLSAQIADTTVNVATNELKVLRISGYVGAIQWQTSNNGTNWTDTIGYKADTLRLNVKRAKYYRAKITAGNCKPYYSQVTYLNLPVSLPTITTTAVSTITASSAISGGSISSDGGANITARGVCYSTTTNPTIANTKTTDGSGSGAFTSTITGLTATTTYYIRAYATNSAGTAYGSQITITTTAASSTTTVTDVDGNVYNTVTIGTQIWMKENLKVTTLNDGTPLTLANGNSINTLTTASYCWYNDSIKYKNISGALYNGYAAIESNKVCPIDWHVPTQNEWNILYNYLGGFNVASLNKMRTKWFFGDNSNNSSGFSLVSSGVYMSNRYMGISGICFIWSSTNDSGAISLLDIEATSLLWKQSNLNGSGLSIRCLKN